MGKCKRTLEQLLADTCDACNKTFRTTQGLTAHQSMSEACSWYKKGKLKQIFEVQDFLGAGVDERIVVEQVQCVLAICLNQDYPVDFSCNWQLIVSEACGVD